MDYETLLLEVRDGVAHLTLNRPDSANGIDVTMARELEQAVLVDVRRPGRALGAADRRRRPVLRRRRRQDLRRPGGRACPDYLREVATPLHVAHRRRSCGSTPRSSPRCRAAPRARGWAWSAPSDLVLAGESAKFVMAYTGIGVTPDGSSSWFLPRLVGPQAGARADAHEPGAARPTEALDLGLITRVVPDAELEQEGQALAAHLAAGPTRALGGAKRLLHGSLESTLESHVGA